MAMMNEMEYRTIGSALAGGYRAAVYCRLSKDDDLQGESASIANQRDMLEFRRVLFRSRWSFHSENDRPLHPLLLSRCRAGCRGKPLISGLFSLITTKTTEK